jgi:hypothetical protein
MVGFPVLDPKALAAPVGGQNVTVSGDDPVSRVQEQGFAQTAQQSGRVASFLNKTAAPIVKAEGATYGALNAPTVAQIEHARKSGKPITAADLPGDPSSISIRDQAARAGALAVVEDRFEMIGRRNMTEAALAALDNPDMSPADFGASLDVIVESHTDALKLISPSSAAKVSASLALAANSQVQTFSRNYATRDAKRRKNESLANINEIMTAGEETVFAHSPPLPGELVIDPNTGLTSSPPSLKEKLKVNRDRIRSTLELGGHNETKIKTALTTFDKKISDAKIAVVSNYADSDVFFDDPLGAYKELQNGTLPPRIKSIMKSMDPVELGKANRAIRSAIQQAANMVNLENNITTKENKEIKVQSESDYSRGFEGNDLEVMETAADLMGTIDGKRATDMKKIIAGRAGALADDQGAEQELVILQANKSLSMGEINKRKGRLTQEKLSEFIGSLADQRNFKMQEALIDLKGKYRPDLLTPLKAQDPSMRDNTTKYMQAQRKLSKARRAFEKLPADDPAKLLSFEPQDLVANIITETDKADLDQKKAGLEAQIARAAFLPPEQRTPEGMRRALQEKVGVTDVPIFGEFGGSFKWTANQRTDLQVALEAMTRLKALGEEVPQ